jgi:hypothetical protein
MEATVNDNAPPARPSRGDRRATPRRRVLLSGKLAYADTAITADCAIRDLSEGGALVVTPTTLLPSDPFLIVVKHAYLHEARTAWRRDGKSGLAFLASWRLNPHLPDPLIPFRALWLELLSR